MFGRRNGNGASRERREQAETLLSRARAARADDPAAAADLERQAVDLLRQEVSASPDDAQARQLLGRAAYQHAGTLLDVQGFAEAIPVLDEAEQVYAALPSPATDWLADVRARRAQAYAYLGRGPSAVLEMQAVVLAYRRKAAGTTASTDLARVLSLTADVLAVYGDPDLASAAADHAIREYVEQARKPDGLAGEQMPYLIRSLLLARAVHHANGRAKQADAARAVLWMFTPQDKREVLDEDPLDLVAKAPLVLGHRMRVGRTPKLTITLAGALDAVPPSPATAALRERLTRPATDVQLHLPADRVDPQAAPAYAVQLTDLALSVAENHLGAAGRFALEAHYLFATASDDQTVAMRYQFAEFAPAWARALLLLCRQAEAGEDAVLTEDFAAWAARIAARLIPLMSAHAQLRPLVIDCLDTHIRALTALGCASEADAADLLLERVRSHQAS